MAEWRERILEQLPGVRYLLPVRTIRMAVASLVALTWVLLVSHCRIEVVPGFEFVRCAVDIHSSEGADACK